MSAFTRTASGLTNARLFHQAGFTVYIEGKTTTAVVNREPADVHYYRAILKAVRPNKTAKIKVVGNKSTALELADRLRAGNVPNSIVIVDKDLENIASSALPLVPVIRTRGYSWENELWTANVATALIQDLTNAALVGDKSPSVALTRMGKRMRYLAALDAAAQTSGVALLPKNKALGGVNFSFATVSAKEVRRVAGKFRQQAAAGCRVCMSVAGAAMKASPSEVIQGHFWANAVQHYIGAGYRHLSNDTAPSKTAMLNLALAFVRRDVAAAVGQQLISRYDEELRRFGI